MAKKRSVGVTILGLLTMFNYVVNSLTKAVIIGVYRGSFSLSTFSYAFLGGLQKGLTWSTLVAIFFIFFFVLGYYILKLREWARRAIVILSLAEVLIGLGLFIIPSHVLPIYARQMLTKFLTIVYGGIFLYFFTRPMVKEQFRQEAPVQNFR